MKESGREVAVVTLPLEPAHLPKWPVNREAYERLYAFNQRADDYREGDADWQEIRIRPGLAEDAVYRLLPCAGGFEFGGYLTKGRIRFFKCDPTRATMPMSKRCTFHSHPTDLATADLPSANDVFQFFKSNRVALQDGVEIVNVDHQISSLSGRPMRLPKLAA